MCNIFLKLCQNLSKRTKKPSKNRKIDLYFETSVVTYCVTTST